MSNVPRIPIVRSSVFKVFLAPESSAPSSQALGTADWDYDGIAVQDHRPGSFFLGQFRDGNMKGVGDDRHVLVCSGTRGGKGVTVLIPNIILWPGSLVVIDPKGENAIVTARARGKGSAYAKGRRQRVRVLDPFGQVRTAHDDFADVRAGFNPLSLIDPARGESVELASLIADSLIVNDQASDPYWGETARGIIKAVILHVASSKDYAARQRNLVTVRRLVQAGDEELLRLSELSGGEPGSGWSLLIRAMRRNEAFGGVIASTGEMLARLERDSPRQLASVLGVASTNLEFIEGDGMKTCLSRSDFDLSEVKTAPEGSSVFLVLPQRYMGTHYRWLRMMATLFTAEMERVAHPPVQGHPVLMVLDEFAGLKRMSAIENAAAQIAGFGVKLVFVVQTLAQLRETYRDNWETLLANAGLRMFFGNEDGFTREYVSKLVGECEVIRHTRSGSSTSGSSRSRTESIGKSENFGETAGGSYSAHNASWNYGHSSGLAFSEGFTTSESWSDSSTGGWSQSVNKRPLVTPDELGRKFGRRDRPAALVLVSGHQPTVVRRLPYYARELWLEGWFDPHPDHAPPLTLAQLKARSEAEERARIARQKAEERARLEELAAQARQALMERLAAQAKERERQELAALAAKERASAARRSRIEDLCSLAIACVVFAGVAGFLWHRALEADRAYAARKEAVRAGFAFCEAERARARETRVMADPRCPPPW